MMCTYIHDYEIETLSSVKDKDLNELLQDVRKEFGNKHLLCERVFKRKRKFFESWINPEPLEKTLYQLYYKPDDSIEVQVINFYVDNTDWSINTYVSKGYMMAYFYGLLGKKKEKITVSNLRNLINQYDKEEISISRFAEILNT